MASLSVTSSVGRDDKIALSFWNYSISLLTSSSNMWGPSLSITDLEAGIVIRDYGTTLPSLKALQMWIHKCVCGGGYMSTSAGHSCTVGTQDGICEQMGWMLDCWEVA